MLYMYPSMQNGNILSIKFCVANPDKNLQNNKESVCIY